MYTTHGVYIPGSRALAGNPPPIRRPCGGIEACALCSLEAEKVGGNIDYSNLERYTDMTLMKVYTTLCEAGASELLAKDMINALQAKGILFRERKQR